MSIHGYRFTFKHLCWHSITKILRNGPRAHFPFTNLGKTNHHVIRSYSLVICFRPLFRTRLLSAFRDRGVPKPTSEMSSCAPAQMGRREAEHEGGEVRWPEMGVREVEIPRPSCSSRAQVGCACSRGLQASMQERERAASRERLSRPRLRAANPL
jgi:hypothetical protein